MLFMGILTVALTNFIVGSIIGPADIEEVSKGFFGYSSAFEILATIFAILIYYMLFLLGL